MDIQKRRDFLTNVAYWAVIFGAGYLVFEYLVPISVPVILGVLIAYLWYAFPARYTVPTGCSGWVLES